MSGDLSPIEKGASKAPSVSDAGASSYTGTWVLAFALVWVNEDGAVIVLNAEPEPTTGGSLRTVAFVMTLGVALPGVNDCEPATLAELSASVHKTGGPSGPKPVGILLPFR